MTDRPRPKVWGRAPGADLAGQGVRRVALVACSNRKRAAILPAGELYVGRTFLAAKAWAETHADAWFVLSALHFLVDPRRELEPYDYAWQHLDAASRRCRVQAMATSVTNLLAHICDWSYGMTNYGEDLEVTVLAGGHYADAVRLATASRYGFQGAVHFPLQGLGIGQQYAWLRGQLATAPPTPPAPVDSNQLSFLEA